MKTTHEEADPIAAAQAPYVAKVEGKSVGVVAGDTNGSHCYFIIIFCLNLYVPMIMKSPKRRDVELTFQLLLTRTKT